MNIIFNQNWITRVRFMFLKWFRFSTLLGVLFVGMVFSQGEATELRTGETSGGRFFVEWEADPGIESILESRLSLLPEFATWEEKGWWIGALQMVRVFVQQQAGGGPPEIVLPGYFFSVTPFASGNGSFLGTLGRGNHVAGGHGTNEGFKCHDVGRIRGFRGVCEHDDRV